MTRAPATAWAYASVIAAAAAVPAFGQTFYPAADGTLVDGDGFGLFDGIADHADWSFNESSYEGSVSRTASMEQRVIWEFNLASVAAYPVTARLTFTLRGTTRFPADPAPILVYAYPSDLLENFADFSAIPTALVAEESIAPFQSATAFTVNISSVVNDVLSIGVRRVAFRFQIDPTAANGGYQAFFDGLDADRATKPFVTITNRLPGDFDNDDDVDLDDYAGLASCMAGPGSPVSSSCRSDDDLDGDVDLADLEAFILYLASWGN